MTVVPPGWYRDPEGGGPHLRYWDGSGWTDHVTPEAPTPTASVPAAKRRTVWIWLFVVAAVVAVVQLPITLIGVTFFIEDMVGPPGDGAAAPSELYVGDCYTGHGIGDDVYSVDCGDTHTGEVFARFHNERAHPLETDPSRRLTMCQQALTGYLGKAADPAAFDIRAFGDPAFENFFTCVVIKPGSHASIQDSQ